MTGDYLKAGCREARYIEVPCETYEDCFRRMIESMEGNKLIRFVPQGNFKELFMAACGQAHTGSAIMLTGIHSDAGARRLWEYAVKELPRTVTFDLYYCGLIFFDDKRFKQNYIINF